MSSLPPEVIYEYDRLIALSGGLDSVYAAWTYLRDHPDKKLLMLHVNLFNVEKRAVHEAKAVKQALEYFKRVGLTNYRYVEMTYDQRQFLSTINDVEVVGFMIGVFLRARNRIIREIAITASSFDLQQGAEYDQRSKARFDIIKLVAEVEGIPVPPYVFPVAHLTREQMLTELPFELLQAIWFCRRPVNGETCKVCIPCTQTLDLYNQICDQHLTKLDPNKS